MSPTDALGTPLRAGSLSEYLALRRGHCVATGDIQTLTQQDPATEGKGVTCAQPPSHKSITKETGI